MKRHIEILLLAAFAMTAVQCSMAEIEDNSPDRQEPSGKTVTLTVNSSSVGTRTALGENGEVLWETGDEIYINGAVYSVTPDADNPTSATIENVQESDEYLAISPAGHAFTENSNLYFYISESQPYREGSFAAYTNPMVAYSESTDLYFRNLAGIIRIGITGVGTISRITLSSNDVYSLSGTFGIPMDDIISGNLQNYNTAHSSYYSSNYVYMDTRDEFVLDQGTPRYAYFVIPAGTYEYGFSVSMEDTEGNVMIQTTEKTITVGRSEILPMEDFEYAPLEDVVLEFTGSTPTSVDYTVVAEPGQSVAQTALTRTWWDSLRETNAEIPEDELKALLLRYYMISWAGVPESGTFTHTLEEAYNGNGYLSEMTAMTEYVILAGYNTYSGEIVGTVQMCHATTAEAEGPAPELDLSLLTTGFRDYAEFGATIRTTDAADIKCYATTRADYDNKTGAGLDDRTILIDFGLSVGEENVATANTGGLEWYWTSGIQPETEYMILVMAVGESGMETIKTMTHSTPAYLPEDGNWQTLSTDGYMECGLLSGITGGQTDISGLTIEKYGQYDIFRIQNPFYDLGQNNPEFFETIDGCITIDARSGNVILESFANHIGLVYINQRDEAYDPEGMYLISEPLYTGAGTYGYYDAEAGMIDFGNVYTMDSYFMGFNDPSVPTRLWFEKPDDITEPGRTGLAIEPFRRIPQEW